MMSNLSTLWCIRMWKILNVQVVCVNDVGLMRSVHWVGLHRVFLITSLDFGDIQAATINSFHTLTSVERMLKNFDHLEDLVICQKTVFTFRKYDELIAIETFFALSGIRGLSHLGFC